MTTSIDAPAPAAPKEKHLQVATLYKIKTYEEAVLEHLASLTQEQRDSEVGILLIMSTIEAGAAFCIVEGDDILSVVGLIASCQQFLIEDSM